MPRPRRRRVDADPVAVQQVGHHSRQAANPRLSPERRAEHAAIAAAARRRLAVARVRRLARELAAALDVLGGAA